jgi:hypothetical protein
MVSGVENMGRGRTATEDRTIPEQCSENSRMVPLTLCQYAATLYLSLACVLKQSHPAR